MTALLLDTSALLWALAADSRLGREARTLLANGSVVHVSSVSVLEITIKEMLGRLQTPGDVSNAARRAGMVELPFRSAHAAELKAFPELPRHDPFDRMLLAQARCENLGLLTSDRALLSLGHGWVLDAWK